MLLSAIPRHPAADPALDQQRLFAIGLELIRAQAGQLWTDHNTHDPGITILELVSFALTELSYRAGFPIEDLLASSGSEDVAGQFFAATDILPCAPLTIADYRKLIIDLPDVRNAWVLPAPLSHYLDPATGRLHPSPPALLGVREVPIHGRYRVLIDFMEGVTADRSAQVIATVRKTLQDNRNLCEDFVAFAAVPTRDYALCAEIELATGADPVLVEAELRFRVSRYLAPPVYNHTLTEMLSRCHPDGSPRSLPDILDGPRLEHGIIDDAELAAADLRREIRLSDLVGIIMAIDGVRAVRDIVVNLLDEWGHPQAPADKWLLTVPEGHQPRLSRDHGRLVFYKQHLPMPADPARVALRLKAFEAAEHARLESLPRVEVTFPGGRRRDVTGYVSFQHHFPAIYGLGAGGLAATASGERRTQALQLRGYLLLFDQIMAHYASQLALAGQLLSRREPPEDSPTRATRHVTSIPDHDQLYLPGLTPQKLQEIFESDEDRQRRRNRFLDHLLARLAEDFARYADIMRSAFAASPAEVIHDKYAFLDDYPTQGARRGMAATPGQIWNSDHVTGLERRVARLLGILDCRRRNLSEVPYDTYAEIDGNPVDEFRFRVRHRVTQKILLSSSTRYATAANAREEMLRAIAAGQQPEGYSRRRTGDGRHYFNIIDGSGQVLARRIEYFAEETRMEAAISGLMAYLREHYSNEGMYLIENIRLLPEHPDDLPLPVCVDPGCAGCSDDDPYSWRMHIILPAYAGRFANMDFRRFAEETLRQETPAHILPRICWIDSDSMARFEQRYQAWLALSSRASRSERQTRRNELIDTLYQLKNVYPRQQLHGCGEETSPPFILGRTALGSGTSGNSSREPPP